MRLYDTSYYHNDEDVENYLIEVLPVNKTVWRTFYVKKGFSLALNSSNLGYRKVSDIKGLIDIPDGIYEFKQSVKPNIHTVNHFYHFRNSGLLNKIRDERVKLLSDECKLSREEFIKSRNALREIEEYADAAKWKVEECHEKKEGMDLYKWAEKLLEYYTNECQCK